MDIYNNLLNLTIGIIGGIFSSIIVSRIFLITADYKEQIQRVQTHVEVLYCLSGYLYCSKVMMKEAKEISLAQKEKLILILEEEKTRFSQMIFDDLEKELHKIAIDMNDFIEGFKINKMNEQYIKNSRDELDGIIYRFTIYKNDSRIKMRKLLIRDNVLRILLFVFIVIIILTIVSR
ncbi:hypothetical protein [Lachnoclostridium phytofermentans]|nr:hypothetical protein [Lachnoclostridium phytofermentans]